MLLSSTKKNLSDSIVLGRRQTFQNMGKWKQFLHFVSTSFLKMYPFGLCQASNSQHETSLYSSQSLQKLSRITNTLDSYSINNWWKHPENGPVFCLFCILWLSFVHSKGLCRDGICKLAWPQYFWANVLISICDNTGRMTLCLNVLKWLLMYKEVRFITIVSVITTGVYVQVNQ